MNSDINPLEFRNLTIGYRKPLVANLEFALRPREFVTIMGENGCGKTTLIDCLAGCLQPKSGHALFWGEDNQGAARAHINQRVGWVISQKENYPLYHTIGAFLHAIAPFYPTWNWQTCQNLCSGFELDLSKRLIHLSAGEHSKVRLIKALSFEPSLIILDELTANLSPKSKETLLASLLDSFATREMSVLYICHSKEEAVKLSDRIFELRADGLKLLGGQNV